MIEIKITIDTALSLLLDRMNLELKLRQRDGFVTKGSRLENLSYQQLLPIVEASIFDTVFLLPVDLIMQETNLVQIITGTVRALARILHREEFALFSSQRVFRLIQPIANHFQLYSDSKDYRNN